MPGTYNLKDLLKKAEAKGITQQSTLASPAKLLRPWQQESVLYASHEKPETNLGQNEDKLETNIRQTEDKLETNIRQTEDKLETQTETQPRTKATKTRVRNLGQLGQNKSVPKSNKFFARISGLQREILLFLYEECQAIGQVETPPLRLEYLATGCKSTILSLRKTIQRMEIKKLLIRSDYQPGRGGWTQYQLPDEIYQELHFLKSTNKLETNLGQTEDKLETQTETQPRTNASSSSSILNNKKTTTELSDEWNFDITPYAKFGFTFSQVKQLGSLGVISATDVEQSLIEFSYDLENNALPPIKTNKINFLMGLLRSGHLYVSEGFKNEQEATIAEMARRAEAKRKNLLEAKFVAWEASLSEEERKEIEKKLPTQLMVLHRAHGIGQPDVRRWFFDYFIQNVKG